MITTVVLRDVNGTPQYADGAEIPVLSLFSKESTILISPGFYEDIEQILISPAILTTGSLLKVSTDIFRIVKRNVSKLGRNQYYLQRKSK